MDRSIFTVEEDPNSPWDLQLVSKRYIGGRDQVKEIGSDAPLQPNRNENIETIDEEVPIENDRIATEGDSDVQTDPQEIHWTKRYQAFAHEGGALPAENRPVFDMISGAELGDNFMKDPSCEVPGMIRHDSGLGADQMFTDLPEDKAPEVPWIPVRTAWYTESPLDKKAIKRILKEEKVDTEHYDVRQRLVNSGPHKFSNGKTAQGHLIVVEAKTNCLQKHFPAQALGMSDYMAPPAEQDIFRSNFLSGTDDVIAPAAEQDIYRGHFLGYIASQRAAIKQGLGQLRATDNAIRERVPDIRHNLKKKLRARHIGDAGIGASAFDSFNFTSFTPKAFTPFQNLALALKPKAQGGTAPAMPAFDATRVLLSQGLPRPPASLTTLPAFNFQKWELGEQVTRDIQTASDEMKKSVTTFTNKSPPWKFSWKEPIGAKNTFAGEDADFVQAMIKTQNKMTSLYTFKDGVSEYIENFKRLFNGSSAMSQLAGSYVAEIVTAMKASLNSFIKSGDATFKVVTAIPKKLMEFMETNAKILHETAKAAGDQALKDMGVFAKDLQTYIKDLVAAIEKDIIGLKDYLVANLTNIQVAVVLDAGELQQYIVGIFNDFKNWLVSNIKNFSGTVSTEVRRLVDEGSAIIKQSVTDTRVAAERLVTDLTAKMNASITKVQTDFKAAVDKITVDFNASYTKLVASLTGTIEVVKKQGEMLTDQIKKVTDLKVAYEKFTEATGQRFSNIEAKIGTVSAQATAAAGEKKGLFASLFSGAKRHIHLGQPRAPRPIPPPQYAPPPPAHTFLKSGFVSEVDGFV
jgi:hypothetical protein